MYIILLSNRLWYTADTWQEVIDFLRIIYTADKNAFYESKVLKEFAKSQWEEVAVNVKEIKN